MSSINISRGANEELYISFSAGDAGKVDDISRLVSFDRVSEDSVYAYLLPYSAKAFAESGIPFSVLRHPGDIDFDPNMKSWGEINAKNLEENWDFYPEYEAYVSMMNSFEEEFPDLVRIYNIGQTVHGRDILFANISGSPDKRRPVPQFMYTSTIHGDETAGFILSLRLIHYLLSNYGKDEGVTTLIDNTDIWICPNENPDGTYRHDNSTISGATRSNLNGVDLNRNYPNPVNDPWDEQQPETAAMISFTDTMSFIMSANLHGGAELVNFPFDSWRSDVERHADHYWWGFVMAEYVDTVHANSADGYMTGQGSGVTHGGDWYVIYGGRQDYFNYYRSCREFTLELSNQKILAPELLPDIWEYNYRSLINYIRQSNYGVHGMVYDNNNGEPVEAAISLPGHDRLGSEIRSSMPHGNFHRPLREGVYDMIFSAEGHEDLFVEGVAVEDYEQLKINIALGGEVSGDLCNVSLTVEGKGNTAPFEGNRIYNSGARIQLDAVAEENWEFDRWIINGTEIYESETEITVESDLDILAVFSEPVSVAGPEGGDHGIVVYPNPLDEGSVLSIDKASPGKTLISVYNTKGLNAVTIHDGFLPAGRHTFKLGQLHHYLNAGVYTVKVSGPGYISTFRIINSVR